MTDLAFLFPGQGSQYVGRAGNFHDSNPAVRELFEQASSLLRMDMRELCFRGPESELKRTDIAQPAVTLATIAALTALRARGVQPGAVAGHSLGEYAALFAAGVLSLEDTLKIVQHRGQVMHEASLANPGGMLAVIGLGPDAAGNVCGECRQYGQVDVANFNSPSQLVLSGEAEALKQAAKAAKLAGARLTIPLKVSGPWHSGLMTAAGDRMRLALESIRLNDPEIPVVSNVTGRFYSGPEEIRSCLVLQVTQPVRWVDSVRALQARGMRRYLEVGPGKVLTGLVREILPEASAANVEDSATLEKACALLQGEWKIPQLDGSREA